jgi:hypothetical protein
MTVDTILQIGIAVNAIGLVAGIFVAIWLSR